MDEGSLKEDAMSEKGKSWARGTKRVGGLEVNEDLNFQRHLWAF